MRMVGARRRTVQGNMAEAEVRVNVWNMVRDELCMWKVLYKWQGVV